MPEPLSDEQVQSRIEALEAEERRLRDDEAEVAATRNEDQLAADAKRLGAIKVELDQLWDYLRQRRALRDSGQNPDAAVMRDEGTVEGYLG